MAQGAQGAAGSSEGPFGRVQCVRKIQRAPAFQTENGNPNFALQEHIKRTLNFRRFSQGLILNKNKKINYKTINHNDRVAQVSIVGAGMVSTPGVTYKMFRGLADEKINILAISSSEIKLSVIIDEEKTLIAVKKLHTIFDLD